MGLRKAVYQVFGALLTMLIVMGIVDLAMISAAASETTQQASAEETVDSYFMLGTIDEYPVTLYVKSESGEQMAIVIDYENQSCHLAAGTYQLKKATDGNGNKLTASNKRFEIDVSGGACNLGLARPSGRLTILRRFLIDNTVLLLMLGLAYYMFQRRIKRK